ncbi:MAG: type II toxin-antitoxin system PemK/MazF family toxin [Acidobacteriota bacterium]
MKRGEVWWAEMPPPAGRRPVLLLSRDEAYSLRNLVIVAPVTTRVRGIPAEVPLGPQDGLQKACVVNLDVLATIDKACLRAFVSQLSPARMRAVDDAPHFVLQLKH